MIDGPNLYGYVFGNPLKWYDPLGLCGADGDDQTKTKEKTARAAAEILSSAWDSIVDNVTEFVIDKATKSPLLSLFHSALGGADTLKNVQTITEPARQEQLNRIQQWNKLMDEIGTGPYVPPSSKK